MKAHRRHSSVRVSDAVLRKQVTRGPVLVLASVAALLWAWWGLVPTPLLLLLPVLLLAVGACWGRVLPLHPRAHSWAPLVVALSTPLTAAALVRATPSGAERELAGACAALVVVLGAMIVVKARRLRRFRDSIRPWSREPRTKVVVVTE